MFRYKYNGKNKTTKAWTIFEILEFSKLFFDIHSPVALTLSCAKTENNYDTPQETAERIGRWKFEKGVEFNGNLDKNRIEHLLFNLLSYIDENMNIQKSNIDDIVTELSDILMFIKTFCFSEKLFSLFTITIIPLFRRFIYIVSGIF
jgi:hypothetical protein